MKPPLSQKNDIFEISEYNPTKVQNKTPILKKFEMRHPPKPPKAPKTFHHTKSKVK